MSLWRGRIESPEPDRPVLPEEEAAVIEKVAEQVVKRSMTVPAIIFFESVKPMNFIGSQAMVFFEPIVQGLFEFKDYTVFRQALEKRTTLETLIQRIEALDAIHVAREKRINAFYKQEKKKWKWYQRYLGIFQPKLQIPDDVLNGPEPEKKPEKK
jgi:hypothetical protein